MFPWAEIQPGSANEMKEGYYSDARIKAQAARGITQVGVIVYTPAWAAERSGSSVALRAQILRPVETPSRPRCKL